MSLVADSLNAATMNPSCRLGILRKVVDEISAITGEKLDVLEIAEMLAGGKEDKPLMNTLGRDFALLINGR